LLGVAGKVRGCSSPTLHPDKLIRVKTVLTGPLSSYVELASNIGVSRTFIESRARTTAGQKGISGSDIKQILIPLPPLIEQEQIVALVEEQLSIISELETTMEHSLQRAERERQSILREAFAGRLVPQDPGNEPASVLLERIREERELSEQEGREAKKQRGNQANQVKKSKKPLQPVLIESN
jgi:type I restriction enzyme, S subunit